jgi:hypothetical protein
LTDARLTQRWSVIDAIPHHGYRSIFLYLPGNQCTFVFREKVGAKLDDAQLVGHIFGYFCRISGQQNNPDIHFLKGFDRWPGAWPYLVGNQDGA